MHVFIAMESDYDGAWIWGVYTTLDAAMARLAEAVGKGPAYALNGRYGFVEEWRLDSHTRVSTHRT